MSRLKMVTNNKSFMQPMRRLSMHKTGDEMRSQDGKHCTEKKEKEKEEEDQTSFFTEFGPHGNETQKNKPLNITKVDSQTPKKNSLYVVIRVPR